VIYLRDIYASACTRRIFLFFDTDYLSSAPASFSSVFAARSIAQLQRNNRAFPAHLNALAVLVPYQRTYATETSTSSSSGTPFPPPGFDANQAKQPYSSQPSDQAASKNGPSQGSSSATPNSPQTVASLDKNLAGSVKITVESEKRAVEKKEETKKMTIGQKIKHEIQHYWDGTKLLATEARISVKLAMKMAAGYELSRRENRQVRFAH
jgi:LETM1 and EF-hand domain-containing protein 1, mitochondrial